MPEIVFSSIFGVIYASAGDPPWSWPIHWPYTLTLYIVPIYCPYILTLPLLVHLRSDLCVSRWPPFALTLYIAPIYCPYALTLPLLLHLRSYLCFSRSAHTNSMLFYSPYYSVLHTILNFIRFYFQYVSLLSLLSVFPRHLSLPYVCPFIMRPLQQASTCWSRSWCTQSTKPSPTSSSGETPRTSSEKGCWETG